MVINHSKNGRRRKGRAERSGTEREGQGPEEEWRRRADGQWTVEVGKVGERPRSFPDLVLVPSLCGMRPHPGPRMAVESRLSCRPDMSNKCE